ncbi:MAG: YcbK family protein [Gammaproteobacteria bacterium]
MISRRSFVRSLAGASAAGFLTAPFDALARLSTERRLNLFHTHTRERLDVVYFSRGNYLADAEVEIRNFLRDHRTEETHPIDPALFDILHAITHFCHGAGCFQVISGYRSPATNAMLRRSSRGVARQSLHMVGKAIDVRLTGIDTRRLRNLAVALKQGGVGYYRESDFVHIDTGRFRTW